jgi:Ca-activated chloride channel homolog
MSEESKEPVGESRENAPVSRRGARVAPPRRRVVAALRIVAWLVTSVLLFAGLYLLFQKYVLLHPDPTIAFGYEGKDYQLVSPRLLGVGLIAPWFLLILPLSLADLPWPQRVLSLLLRTAFVALLGLSLARLVETATTEKVCAVYLVDVSNSVTDEALADAREIVKKALAEKPEDGAIRLVTFAERARLVDIAEDGSFALERHVEPGPDGKDVDRGAGSNLTIALQLAYGLYPPGYLKRAVLVSDGAQTEGDVLAEANRAAEFGVRLFTVPYTRPLPGEVAVQELKMPARVKVGETFEPKAKIYASRATKARAKLYQGEVLNGLDGVRDIDLKAGPNEIPFKSVVRVAGPVTYSLELENVADDRFPENNRVAVTIDVPGRPMVLYVEGTPEQASALSGALTAQQFDVEVRSPTGFPGSIEEISRYDFVVVSDVEKAKLELSAQDLIERYVRDLGGGFLFAGGESSFGLGGWHNTTIERILPVRMDSDSKKEMPSVALSLVIDRSGSMMGNPMEMAKEAAKATLSTLAPDDLIEVIAFDSSPHRYVKMQPARNQARISSDIARIQPGGGTEIFSALDAAFQDLTVTQARRKHVILLTDGRANTSGINDLVAGMVAESITITTVGLGSDLDEAFLRGIAETGGGRFHAVLDANSLPKIFTKETELIAKSAAVEEWFQVTQTGDAQFLAGLDVRTAPFLHGYVSTQMKPTPAEEILVSDTGEPILARWRVGLGYTLAWTSDVKPRWAVEWIKWPGFERFWGQLVREHMRQKHTRELDMKAEVVGGRLLASVDAFTTDERFDNGLQSRLTVTGPEPKGQATVVDLRQTAPGRYEADYLLPKYGSYLLKAEHLKEQPDGSTKVSAVSYGHVSNPYPREYASFEPDTETLRRAAVAAGGEINPASIQVVFDPKGESVTYQKDLWNRFLMAAIGVFLLDLLLRRVRIFDRKFVAKPRRLAT